MKKVLLMAALGLGLAFSANAGTNYTISVVNDNLTDGDVVYLYDYDTQEKVDSAVVTNDMAVIVGTIEKPYLGRLISDGARMGNVVVESGNIKVDNGETSGSPLNDKLAALNNQMSALVMRYRQATSGDEENAIEAQYNKIMEETMAENIDNPIGYMLFIETVNNSDKEEVDALVAKYPQMKDFERVKKVYKVYEAQDATAVGKMFTDFEIEYNGVVTKLSDIVGKGHPVLVDMWASWCGPCRREASTTLKDIYAEYTDKGLEVVGIAVWDEPENTLKAIEQMQLPWRQVLNGGNVPTDAYGVLGIPFIILFAPDGTILSRNQQGASLKADVKEAMEKYGNK